MMRLSKRGVAVAAAGSFAAVAMPALAGIPGGRYAVLRVIGSTDIWSLPPCTSTAIGYPPVAKRRGISRSTASASPSSRRCRNMKRSRNCSCL